MSKIKLNATSGGGSVSLEAPTSTTGNANVEFKLPVADGTNGQAVTTNASGQLAFSSISSRTTAVPVKDTSSPIILDIDCSAFCIFKFISVRISITADS